MAQPLSDSYRHARCVLVLLNWGIGDTLKMRPALAGLRRAAPSAQIVAMGSQTALEVLEDHRLVDQLVSYQSLGVDHDDDEDSPEVRTAILAWLDRTGPYDALFSCQHAPAAVRSAICGRGRQMIEPDETRQPEAPAHCAVCQRALLETAAAGWGIPMEAPSAARLDPPAFARRDAAAILEAHGLGDETPTAISPTASPGLKRWPAERFADLGKRLIESARSALLIFAGDEPHIAREVHARIADPARAVIIERCHLLVTAALVQRCRVFICNDTGLLHLAAAVGTPVIGVPGQTDPAVCRPQFPWAISLGEDGSDAIDVDDVWHTLCGLIPLRLAAPATGRVNTTTGAPGRGAGREETQPEPPSSR